jgi:hypothetical protein
MWLKVTVPERVCDTHNYRDIILVLIVNTQLRVILSHFGVRGRSGTYNGNYEQTIGLVILKLYIFKNIKIKK